MSALIDEKTLEQAESWLDAQNVGTEDAKVVEVLRASLQRTWRSLQVERSVAKFVRRYGQFEPEERHNNNLITELNDLLLSSDEFYRIESMLEDALDAVASETTLEALRVESEELAKVRHIPFHVAEVLKIYAENNPRSVTTLEITSFL